MNAQHPPALLWALLLPFAAFLPLAPLAVAESRLPIEVMPIEVVMDAGTDSACISNCESTLTLPPDGAFDAAIIGIRNALGLLGVEPDEYDLTVSSEAAQRLTCALPNATGNELSCTHASLGAFDRTKLHDMMIEFGHRRASAAHKGTVLMGVLLLPEEFEWARSLYGVNKWWSWNGFAAADLHWTTTSCSIWSAPWLRVLAHEIGHCFGLWHADDPAGDRNYDGSDNSVDLMGTWSSGTHLGIRRLRQSNAARVRHHFRVLEQVESGASATRYAVPGRVAID